MIIVSLLLFNIINNFFFNVTAYVFYIAVDIYSQHAVRIISIKYSTIEKCVCVTICYIYVKHYCCYYEIIATHRNLCISIEARVISQRLTLTVYNIAALSAHVTAIG